MNKRTIIAGLLNIADKLDETRSQELIKYSNALTKIAEELADNYNTFGGFMEEPTTDDILSGSKPEFDGPIDLGTDNGNDIGLDLGSGDDLDIGGDLDNVSDDSLFENEHLSEQMQSPGLSQVASIRLKKKLRI